MPARTAPAAKADPKPKGAKAALPTDPLESVGQFVAGDQVMTLATEHERQIAVLIAESAAVTDVASYERVGRLFVAVAERKRGVETYFAPMKTLAHQMHKMICGRENDILRPLIQFESLAKGNWDRFRRVEEQKRRDEEARQAREAQLAEQERLQREAELLAERGETDLANQVMEQAIATPAPVMTIASNLPEIKGVSTRENWTWRPIGGDTAEGRARAEKLVPREFLCLDEKKLNAYAKAHKASARIPGLEFYDAGSVSVRT